MHNTGIEHYTLKCIASIGSEKRYRNNGFPIENYVLNGDNNKKLCKCLVRKNPKESMGKEENKNDDEVDINEKKKINSKGSLNSPSSIIKSLKVIKYGSAGIKPFIQFISENIFKIKSDYFSSYMIPILQKILNSLKEKHNQIVRLFDKKIESLNIIIDKKLQNIDQKDLLVMQTYYNFLPKHKHKKLKSKYKLILSLNHRMNYVIIKRHEIYNITKYFFKFFKNVKCEFNFLRKMASIVSSTTNKLMHNMIFFYPSIFPLGKIFEHFYELFDVMDNLIENIKTSLKNGFLLLDRTKMDNAQKIMDSMNNKLRHAFYRHLDHFVKDLNLLNLSNEDNYITMQTIFYFLKKENLDNRRYLEETLKNPCNTNITSILFDLLVREGDIISEYYNKAHNYFNLNFYEKNKNNICLNDLIQDKVKKEYLLSLYSTLMKLMRITFFHNKLQLIMEMRKSLKKINSKRKRKYISVATKNVLTQSMQSYLLSEVEKQKNKLEEIKFDIKYSHLFSSLKKDIDNVNVLMLITYEKIEEIALTFQLITFIIHQDLVNAKKTNGEKLVRPENILFALFYVKHIITKCTIEEMQ
ncbi:hypothetical protein PRELSG_1146500 [Plasmodium relictum]|uniref:Fam-j protein n=1 Tax=Plasmodium relictum TaxID=85471 RepID=A0A1J1HCG7_PLARL|nr:hypothetical protein PRELSG_1146500 [Plasmodium relictum]CRH01116.1 hypothetical protein PRELSG_1146500 [Plasmodium relictum]